MTSSSEDEYRMSNMAVKDVKTMRPAQKDPQTVKTVKPIDGSADKDETVKFARPCEPPKSIDKQEAARANAKSRLQK